MALLVPMRIVVALPLVLAAVACAKPPTPRPTEVAPPPASATPVPATRRRAPEITRTPAWVRSATPRWSATPTATVPALEVLGPLVPAGSGGRIYSGVKVDGTPATGVFDVRDGSWIGSIPLFGGLAMDEARGQLYVDEEARGLHVLDAASGEERAFIAIPTVNFMRSSTPLPAASTNTPLEDIPPVAPAVDPTLGDVVAARWSALWLVNGEEPRSARAVEWSSGPPRDGRTVSPRRPIRNLHFGPGGRLHGDAYGMNVFGDASLPFAIDLSDANDIPLFPEAEETDSCITLAILPDLTFYGCNARYSYDWVFDRADGSRRRLLSMPEVTALWLPDRQLLMAQAETPAGDLLRIDTRDGSVETVLAPGILGELSAYDEATGALLSFDSERVHVLPLAAALAPTAETPSRSPRVAITAGGAPFTDALLRVVPPGPHRWSLEGRWSCQPVPRYSEDPTLFCPAHIDWTGGGLFRISDHGRRVKAITHGLPSWAVRDVAISPDFARDSTVFVALDPWAINRLDATLWRSTDQGETWEPSGYYTAVAFSPDFATDRTVYAFGYGNWPRESPPNQMAVSHDGGVSWETSGSLPADEATVDHLIALAAGDGRGTVLLALAPTLHYQISLNAPQWSNFRPAVFRSDDAGSTWRVTAQSLGVRESWNIPGHILEYRQASGAPALLLTDWSDPDTGMPDRWSTPKPRPTSLPAPTDSPEHFREPTDILRSTDLGATWRYVAVEGVECEERSLGVDTNRDLVCRDAAGNIRNIAEALSPRATYVVPTATPTATPTVATPTR